MSDADPLECDFALEVQCPGELRIAGPLHYTASFAVSLQETDGYVDHLVQEGEQCPASGSPSVLRESGMKSIPSVLS